MILVVIRRILTDEMVSGVSTPLGVGVMLDLLCDGEVVSSFRMARFFDPLHTSTTTIVSHTHAHIIKKAQE